MQENVYENLKSPAQYHRYPPTTELNAVTNPDYCYPSAINSQSGSTKHSYSQSRQSKGIQQTSHHVPITHLSQSQPASFQQLYVHPEPVVPAMTQPQTWMTDNSSSTSSATEEPAGKQKTVNFVEPPKQYLQSTEAVSISSCWLTLS